MIFLKMKRNLKLKGKRKKERKEAEIEMTGRPLNEAHTCVTLRN